MVITSAEFKKITKFIAEQLVANCGKVTLEHSAQIEVLPKIVAQAVLDSLTLDDFLKAAEEKKEKKKAVPADDNKGFSKLWKTYPGTPNFKHKGMVFRGSRTLRSNFDVCEALYLSYLIHNPEVTPEQILKALEMQLTMAKDESVKLAENKIQFWSMFEVYLRQAKFEPFLEMVDLGEDMTEQRYSNSSNCG